MSDEELMLGASREDDIFRLMEEARLARESRIQAETEASKPVRTTGSQAFGHVLTSILPVILGAAIGGRKGARAGIAPAAAANQAMVASRAKEAEDQQKILERQADTQRAMEKASMGQIASAQNRRFAADESEQREDRRDARFQQGQDASFQKLMATLDSREKSREDSQEHSKELAQIYGRINRRLSRQKDQSINSRNERSFEQKKELQQDRLDNTNALVDRKVGRELAEREIPGLPFAKDEKGNEMRPSSSASTEARTIWGDYLDLQPAAQRLRTSLKEGNVAEQEAALSGMVIKIKNLANMGANFTEMENELTRAGLPGIIATSSSEIIRTLKKGLVGQDGIKRLDFYMQDLNAGTQGKLRANSYDLTIPSRGAPVPDKPGYVFNGHFSPSGTPQIVKVK